MADRDSHLIAEAELRATLLQKMERRQRARNKAEALRAIVALCAREIDILGRTHALYLRDRAPTREDEE